MLCQKCKKNDAVCVYSENINGQKHTLALCGDCFSGEIPFNDLLFWDSLPEDQRFSNKRKNPTKRCDCCGLCFNDIKKSGKVGCPECYRVFSDELSAIIRHIHKTAVYKGKTVKKNGAESKDTKNETENVPDTAKNFKEELKRAIEEENYERAAELRDLIRSMTEKEEEK